MKNIFRRTLISWGVTAIVNTASPAIPQPMGPSMGAPGKGDKADRLLLAAERWDVNHDGVLTCDEWTQYASRIFRLADKESDGFLSPEEFRRLGKIDPIFADADLGYFDESRDGRVSLNEFTTKPNPLFLRYDLNGDCRITSQETNGKASTDKPKGGPPGAGGGPGGAGPGGMGRF